MSSDSATNTPVLVPILQATTATLLPLGFRTPTPTPAQATPPPETNPAPVTPIASSATLTVSATPETVTVTPLPPLPTFAPTLVDATPTIAGIPQDVPENPQTRAFALRAAGGAITGSGFILPFGATTFARNPLDPSRMAVVDTRGLLYLFFGSLNVQDGARVRVSPFLDSEPLSEAENQARVVQITWSPNGAFLAFLVDGEMDDRDGLWLLIDPLRESISNGLQVFRECPAPVQTVCTVDRTGGPFVYNSRRFEWSSRSDALLVELDLPEESRRAFTVVGLNSDPNRLPRIYRYDYATWSWDGTRILASGGGEDGRVGLRWIDPATGSVELFLDSGAGGLWLQNAVQRENGQIVALGSPLGAGSPMQLFDGGGVPLTELIGTTAPERVTWSPDRSAALVVTPPSDDGTPRRYFVASVDGLVREITASVAGALAVDWINDSPLPSSEQPVSPSTTPPPAPNVRGNYGLAVNQQVQVIAPAGVILRAEPSTTSAELTLLNAFEYVVIVGGPVEAEGLIWWQVTAPSGMVGWAAESVGGVQLLSLEPR